jgi:hypothetical protein
MLGNLPITANAIWLSINICVTVGTFVLTFMLFEHSQQTENRMLFIINFIMMCWTLFVSMYLIKQFNVILSQPLNSELNSYETVAKAIFFLYLFIFIKVWKSKNIIA